MILKYQVMGIRVLLVGILSSISLAATAQSPRPLFSSRSLAGWSSAQPHYWSVKKKAIIGHAGQKVPRNEFLWSDVEVADFYLSVDVMLDPNDCNAGIQFRSRKADSTGQAVGYQADIGKDVWGRLYHEHDRGKLDWSDRGEKAVKPGKWNHYEILAVGDRIWTAINGQLAVAVRDPGGESKGYIALQIHSGAPQTVKYKIRKLVHNPPVTLAGLDESWLNAQLKSPLASVKPEVKRDPILGEETVLALAGGTNIANMRQDGYLETLLYASAQKQKIRVWNLGWDGDTVYEQFRDVGFGSWAKSADSLGAEVILFQFGQMEALQGVEALPGFVEAYREMLSKAKKSGLKVVVLSPVPFEPERLFRGVKMPNPLTNADVALYKDAVAQLAKEEKCHYIDLYTPLLARMPAQSLTRDGIHLNADGQKLIAGIVAGNLRGEDLEYDAKLDRVRKEVTEKNYLWISYWRPGNWAFLYGDRTTQPFSHDWQDKGKRIFPDEVKRFEPMILEAEGRIVRESRKTGALK